MKDRALRRHQDFKAKKRALKQYNSCIEELSNSKKQVLESNIEKLKKVCTAHFDVEHPLKDTAKTLQELRHDITLKEQMI